MLGAWLALFALALQLALSFGHVHPEDFAVANSGIVTIGPHNSGTIDDDGDHHGPGHADCTICAVIHLAGTLLLSPPPFVALPATESHAWFAESTQYDAPHAPRQPFQARAPPQA